MQGSILKKLNTVRAFTHNQDGVAPLLLLIAVIGLMGFLLIASTAPLRNNLLSALYPKTESQAAFVPPTPFPGCIGGNITPKGQANPSVEYEPMGNIWCYPLATPPAPTRISGNNSWIDEFNINQQMTRFEDGDLDYRIFNKLAPDSDADEAKHWLNANHWMTDAHHEGNGQASGIMMRPNKAFYFENGKLIIEADVAHNMLDYDGRAWPEIGWSTAPEPNLAAPSIDYAYIYGMFRGHYAAGCRMQGTHGNVCAGMNNTVQLPPGAAGQCGSQTSNGRLFENQGGGALCATRRFNLGEENLPLAQRPTRRCERNQMDMFCRDRFRFEWSKDGVVFYTNGIKTYEYAGLPAANSFPDHIANGTTPVYVYFGEHSSVDPVTIRTHWDRIAVNPKDIGSHIMPPTQSPSYCPGEPQNTCPMVMQSSGLPAVSKKQVDILDFVFSPNDIIVEEGTTVTWTNKSASGMPHSVTSDQDGLFDSGIFNPGQSFSHTFNTVGEFPYYCIPHPGMTGKVIVLPKDGSPMPSGHQMSPTPASSVASPTPAASVGLTFYATLDGAKNIPPITTSSTGYSQITLSPNETSATVTLYYTPLTSTNTVAHIHGPADAQTNAGIIYGLNIGVPGQVTTTTISNLTAQQVADLKNGLWYVNVHSNNFPTGEIRGQYPPLSASPVPSGSAKPGDIDGNNRVDIFDYNRLLTDFGKTGQNIPGDVDRNGRVDIFDYNILLSNFGK